MKNNLENMIKIKDVNIKTNKEYRSQNTDLKGTTTRVKPSPSSVGKSA